MSQINNILPSFEFKFYKVTFYKKNRKESEHKYFKQTKMIKKQNKQIFIKTDNYLQSISKIQAQQLNPQKLLMMLINNSFKQIECQQSTKNKQKITLLTQQLSQIRKKISTRISSNNTVLQLIKNRDNLVLKLQQLLKQRNKTQYKMQINQLREKHNFKNDISIKQFKSSSLSKLGINNNKLTIKENLRYYRMINKQMQSKIKQLNAKCSQIEGRNNMIIQQQQIQQRINSIGQTKPKPIQKYKYQKINKTNRNYHIQKSDNKNNKNQYLYQQSKQTHNQKTIKNKNQQYNKQITSSNLWIQKIDQIKNKFFTTQKQLNKLTLYNKINNCRQHIISDRQNHQYNCLQRQRNNHGDSSMMMMTNHQQNNNTNIKYNNNHNNQYYSNSQFYINNNNNHNYKSKSKNKYCPNYLSLSKSQILFMKKSQPKLFPQSQNKLSRVKSLKSTRLSIKSNNLNSLQNTYTNIYS